uniref:Uncharacterized protein n=1 Tax=Pipistrellus kuhlii TaxID=59472 RepID=A0A7J7VMZ2_PIPKU|nr:hypothetical protein mPipKuh1_008388 [Pipistrellus kuhlii]
MVYFAHVERQPAQRYVTLQGQGRTVPLLPLPVLDTWLSCQGCRVGAAGNVLSAFLPPLRTPLINYSHHIDLSTQNHLIPSYKEGWKIVFTLYCHCQSSITEEAAEAQLVVCHGVDIQYVGCTQASFLR